MTAPTPPDVEPVTVIVGDRTATYRTMDDAIIAMFGLLPIQRRSALVWMERIGRMNRPSRTEANGTNEKGKT